MILDQGHICFRTIRQIQGALRSIASGQLNILHQSRHPLSLCSKFDEDADQRHRANRDTIRLSSMLPSGSPISADYAKPVYRSQ